MYRFSRKVHVLEIGPTVGRDFARPFPVVINRHCSESDGNTSKASFRSKAASQNIDLINILATFVHGSRIH